MRGKCHPSFNIYIYIYMERRKERGREDGGGRITLLISLNKGKQSGEKST